MLLVMPLALDLSDMGFGAERELQDLPGYPGNGKQKETKATNTKQKNSLDFKQVFGSSEQPCSFNSSVHSAVHCGKDPWAGKALKARREAMNP